jgi:hypothetical protein
MSGYMMKGETLDGKLRTRIARMSWLLLWSTCFYACFKVLMHHREPTFAVVPTCEQLKAFIYFNANPFGGHLWYISAYIYVCALCLLINKFNMWKIAYMSVPILLLMNLVLDCYSVALFRHSFPIYYARNFLLVGMPFTLIGKYLSENKCEMIKTTWGGVVLFSTTSILEMLTLKHFEVLATSDLYLSSIFLSISLFLLFVSHEGKSDTEMFLAKLGREYSLSLYIYHIVFTSLCKYFYIRIPFETIQHIYIFTFPLIVLLATFLLGFIFRKVDLLSRLHRFSKEVVHMTKGNTKELNNYDR